MDGYHHFGFHSYHYPVVGEQFWSVEHEIGTGHGLHVEDLLGTWICIEVAVQPSTKSLKCWINETLYTNLIGTGFVEVDTMQVNRLHVSCAYSAPPVPSPKTQSYYIDDLKIVSGTNAEETAGTLYIGEEGSVSVSPSGSPSSETWRIGPSMRRQNPRKIHPKF